MQDTEKIIGEGILELIQNLQEDRTVISMHLLGKDYKRLTLILGIRTKKKVSYFQIDYPEGFKEAVAGTEAWEIRFQFIGKDKVSNIFNTSGGEITKHEIWIRFPEVIERIQRRRYFRLRAPLGTRIDARIDFTRHEMTVINISEKGALVSLRKESPIKPVLKPGEHLRDFGLVLPSDEEEVKVNIKEALVKTMRKDPTTGGYRYGLDFTNIERDDQNTLRNLIHRLQRESRRVK